MLEDASAACMMWISKGHADAMQLTASQVHACGTLFSLSRQASLVVSEQAVVSSITRLTTGKGTYRSKAGQGAFAPMCCLIVYHWCVALPCSSRRGCSDVHGAAAICCMSCSTFHTLCLFGASIAPASTHKLLEYRLTVVQHGTNRGLDTWRRLTL